jgi:UDPglucose 6-dehydrogenase
MKYTHSSASFIFSSIEEASMTKYVINAFLATKVLFMNEMYDVSSSFGVSWDTLKYLIQFVDEKRIGNSHMQVPGPDGKRGFGGICFPKDTSGLLHFSKSLGVNLDILEKAIQKNKSLRDDL